MTRILGLLLLSFSVLSFSVAEAQKVPVGEVTRSAQCEKGFAGEYPCKGIDLLGFVTMAELGNTKTARMGIRINDIWGWEDPQTGKRYAVVGMVEGTSFVDVTDPSQPVVLGMLPSHKETVFSTDVAIWRDIKVYDHYAYIVADAILDHGIQIFDLHRLRNLTGATRVTLTEDGQIDDIGNSHNIVINEDSGFGYAVGSNKCGGGLAMFDIASSPLSPMFVGCFAARGTGRVGSGYSHDAQCVMYDGPDARYNGREICIGSNETAISIADVTDKANPVGISTATYPGATYVHQGWLTSDHQYFVQNDELDETGGAADLTKTFIWDVSDLTDPILITVYEGPSSSIDHNLYVDGRTVFMSNYTSGLRVLDLQDPKSPVEMAYFDLFPESDVQTYDGTWSNYPFWDDFVIVSHITKGLFILSKP